MLTNGGSIRAPSKKRWVRWVGTMFEEIMIALIYPLGNLVSITIERMVIARAWSSKARVSIRGRSNSQIVVHINLLLLMHGNFYFLLFYSFNLLNQLAFFFSSPKRGPSRPLNFFGYLTSKTMDQLEKALTSQQYNHTFVVCMLKKKSTIYTH